MIKKTLCIMVCGTILLTSCSIPSIESANETKNTIKHDNKKAAENVDIGSKTDIEKVTDPASVQVEDIIVKNTIDLCKGARHQLKISALMSDNSRIDITTTDKGTEYICDDVQSINVTNDGVIEVGQDVEVGQTYNINVVFRNIKKNLSINIIEGAGDIKINEDGLAVVTNPDSTQVLANKKRNLPSDYVPEDLVKPDIPFSFDGENEKRYLRKIAADNLELLVNAAKEEDLKIVGVSGYRSYKRQETIFNWNKNQYGFEHANKFSAQPGQSEHQTGLAIDVSCKSVKYDLVQEFGETPEGKWLKDNAHRYGFIIRYQKEKESITGYIYEPWHIRYVGNDIAQACYEQDICLEEYFESN